MLMWYSENCFEDLRSVVGPPAATDWSRPWHEILHDWNAPVAQFVQQYSVKCWSVHCVEMHRNLAQYIANPPPDRWLSRILMWTCRGHHTVGRPRNTWDTTLTTCPQLYIALLKAIYSSQSGAVHGGRPLDIQRGVGQGDILSPLVFNAALECAFPEMDGKM